MYVMLTGSQLKLSSYIHMCLQWSQSFFWLPLMLFPLSLLPPPLLISVIFTPPFFHFSLPFSLPSSIHLLSYFLPHKKHLIAFMLLILSWSSPPSLQPSVSLNAACSHRWSLLRPGYKPASGGFSAGVRSDGVHWEQRPTDLCHLLRLQRTQCGLPGHQERTAEEGESSNTLDRCWQAWHTELRHSETVWLFSMNCLHWRDTLHI